MGSSQIVCEEHASPQSTCATLLERQQQGDFLLSIITGDEKWIMFDNPDKKKSWLCPGEIPEPQPMPEVHQKKLCFVFGGIWKESSITSFWSRTKLSLLSVIDNNYNV